MFSGVLSITTSAKKSITNRLPLPLASEPLLQLTAGRDTAPLNLRRKKTKLQTHQRYYHKVDDHKKERIWIFGMINWQEMDEQERFWHDIWHNLTTWLFFKRSWFETHDAPMIYIHRSWICHNLTADSSHAHLPASIGIARHLQPRPGDFLEWTALCQGRNTPTYPVQANWWLISNTSSIFSMICSNNLRNLWYVSKFP